MKAGAEEDPDDDDDAAAASAAALSDVSSAHAYLCACEKVSVFVSGRGGLHEVLFVVRVLLWLW